jgi:hypothetical protein
MSQFARRIARRCVQVLTALSGWLGTAGCTHNHWHPVTVQPGDVTAVVSQYARDEYVTVNDDSHPLLVTERWSPELKVTRCPSFCEDVRAPLEHVRFDGRDLRFIENPSAYNMRDVRVLPEDIWTATLYLRGYDPPESSATTKWRPKGGWGVVVGGPSGVLAVQGQARLLWWLGIEGGFMGYPFAPTAAGAFGAFRIRPVTFGPLAPMLGWFVNGGFVTSAESGMKTVAGVGPRLGLELEPHGTTRAHSRRGPGAPARVGPGVLRRQTVQTVGAVGRDWNCLFPLMHSAVCAKRHLNPYGRLGGLAALAGGVLPASCWGCCSRPQQLPAETATSTRHVEGPSRRARRRTNVEYVRILHLAASTMESTVEVALALLLEQGRTFDYAAVRDLASPERPAVPHVQIAPPDLRVYDALLAGGAR